MAQQTVSVANNETQSKIYNIVKNGVAGIAPDNMKAIAVSTGATEGTVNITFTEPDSTIVDGYTLCNVRGVRIVMKRDSPPRDENDGTVLLENEVLGKYTETPYEVTGLVAGNTYYFGVFPYSTHRVFNRNAKNIKEIFIKSYTLYGFRVDKNDPNPATRITYLEDAVGMTPAHMDFDTGQFDYGSWDPNDIFFLKNNKPFMVNLDGTPAYELDENDYTKKLDGTGSDISNTSFAGNAMAKMETVWLYQYEDEQYEYCYVSNIKVNDNYHAYAHERADGTIQEYIWLAMFDGALVGSKLRSLKDQSIMLGINVENSVIRAKANGDIWYIRTWSQRNLINMLLFLMFRSDDLQATLGNGYCNGGGTFYSSNCLPTGGAFDKGRFYGSTENCDYVKVFHMENWWGDSPEWVKGILYIDRKVFVKMTPPYSITGEGFHNTDLRFSGSVAGYIDQTSMSQYGRIGYSAKGSGSTYACDSLVFNTDSLDNGTAYGVTIGGYRSWEQQCGPLCMDARRNSNSIYDWANISLSCEEPEST